MTFDFRYPQLTGATEREQLQQLKTYIHQLVDQLKWALNSTEPSQSSYVIVREKVNSGGGGGISTIGLDDDSTQARFNELKPLIIKSAEIIEAYYEAINRRLEGLYVAQSDFGVFAEKTSQEIEETSTNTTQQFQNIQVVVTDIGDNVGSLADEILNISEEFSYTQRDVVDIQSNIQTINGEVVSLSGDVVALDGEVKKVGENVGVLGSEVEGVKTGVQNVEKKAQDIEGNVQTVTEDVEALDASISEVDNSVQSVDDNLWSLDDKLKDAKEGLDSSLGKLSADLGQLDSGVKDLKKNVESELKDVKDTIKDITYTLVEVKASINSGLLYYDENEIPVYGLEIGQKNIINGVEVFNKFARFTSDRLSFYDQNGIEVAYISDRKLYISNVEITTSLKIGGLVSTVMSNGDVVEKWVGRG